MAIRERKGRAAPFEVYWINPWTKKRESRSFVNRQEAEKEDSLIKHRLKFDRESFDKGDVYEQETHNEDTALTLHDGYLLYLRKKQFTKKGTSWQIDAVRYPLQKLGARPLASITKKHLEKLKDEMLFGDAGQNRHDAGPSVRAAHRVALVRGKRPDAAGSLPHASPGAL